MDNISAAEMGSENLNFDFLAKMRDKNLVLKWLQLWFLNVEYFFAQMSYLFV